MGRVSEMALVIEELRRAADQIHDATDWLESQFFRQPEESERPDCRDVTEKEVREVMQRKYREGYRDEVMSLLRKYGAEKLTDLEPAYYSRLFGDVSALGAEPGRDDD